WAHDSLGMMYHYQQRYAEAVKHLEAACEISPDDHRVWGRLGESYRLLEGGMPNARKAFSKALALAANDAEIDPSDWITVGYMALYNGYLGNFAAADELLDRMFKLNAGNDPMTHYWAGLVAYETGDIDKTFHELDLALANGFSKEKHFIADEPALGPLRASQPERFQAMLDRY
ncbi:MAG: tetratricopeptide repeat protein, partial [Gammaproteobacteria bacterium]